MTSPGVVLGALVGWLVARYGGAVALAAYFAGMIVTWLTIYWEERRR